MAVDTALAATLKIIGEWWTYVVFAVFGFLWHDIWMRIKGRGKKDDH